MVMAQSGPLVRFFSFFICGWDVLIYLFFFKTPQKDIVRVHLIDSSSKFALNIDQDTTTAELRQMVVARTSLKEHTYFSLFEKNDKWGQWNIFFNFSILLFLRKYYLKCGKINLNIHQFCGQLILI